MRDFGFANFSIQIYNRAITTATHTTGCKTHEKNRLSRVNHLSAIECTLVECLLNYHTSSEERCLRIYLKSLVTNTTLIDCTNHIGILCQIENRS